MQTGRSRTERAPVFPLIFLCVLLSAAGCRSETGPHPAASPQDDSLPRLGRIAGSPEQLLRNALLRLKSRDTSGLTQMLPDPKLFLDIYVKTPEGKRAPEPLRNFGREFYYLDNHKLLFRRLSRDGGKDLELVSWKATNTPVPVEGGGEILRDLDIRVRDKSDNSIRRLFFVQSIYLDPKGCKIWGFSDEKGRPRND